MHLYIITRGIKKDVDDFITQLQGKFFSFKYREKKEEPFKDTFLQMSVRPIQLWELAYPKEHHDLVCATVLDEDNQAHGNDGEAPGIHKYLNKFFWALRKLLKLNPVGNYKTDNKFPIGRQNMSVIGIGTKEDYTMDTGVEGI